jgi:hypothetical protein
MEMKVFSTSGEGEYLERIVREWLKGEGKGIILCTGPETQPKFLGSDSEVALILHYEPATPTTRPPKPLQIKVIADETCSVAGELANEWHKKLADRTLFETPHAALTRSYLYFVFFYL